MNDCIFCKIVKGEIPSNKVYEDEKVLAFLDIGPVNKGHALVIPKEHYVNIYDIPENLLKNVIAAVKKVSKAVKKGVNADGINLNMSNDPSAGQVVMHSHIHIIPRFKDDGLKHWPQSKYKEGEAEEVKKKIKENL